MTMTREQRAAEFRRLFDAIPAETNVKRIREVCRILQYSEITIRQYLMKNPPRVPSERDLHFLKTGLDAITK